LQRGISKRTLDAAFRHAGFLPGVIERDRAQAESIYGMEDYLAITASADRIKMGTQALRQKSGVLAKLEARYGVEARVVAAIWGVESFYGTKRGTIPVISALSTLAYEGRRADFFEGQLMAALKILAHGDIGADQMTGGWAGAMGHTQFIPTTYLAYAVDYNGDGRRDVWSDDPSDALASAARYLSAAGWQKGQPWGMEVQVSKAAGAQGGKVHKVADWRKLGLLTGRGGQVPDHGPARLVTTSGPGFLLFHNGLVLGKYNSSTLYMVGVGYLSDRIAGKGPLAQGFPPDANGLSQADRIRLQERLTRLGFETGSTDGVFGAKTRAAIAGFQQAHGLPATGVPSPDLLALLR
jgi:lytic murein transglycosylase